MSLKRKKKANLGEPFKSQLVSKTHNSWNPRPELNQEAQFPTNLMFKDEIEKKYMNFLKKSK
jgi:hypothetical protein